MNQNKTKWTVDTFDAFDAIIKRPFAYRARKRDKFFNNLSNASIRQKIQIFPIDSSRTAHIRYAQRILKPRLRTGLRNKSTGKGKWSLNLVNSIIVSIFAL